MARRIILKEDDMNIGSNPPVGYKFLGFDGDTLSERTDGNVTAIQFSLEYVKGKLIEQSIVSSSQQTELSAKFEYYANTIIATDDYIGIVAGVGLISGISSQPEAESTLLAQYNTLTGLNIPIHT